MVQAVLLGVQLMQILVILNMALFTNGQMTMMQTLAEHIGEIFALMHLRQFITKIYANSICPSLHLLMLLLSDFPVMIIA